MRELRAYRKLVACAVGILLMLLLKRTGLDLTDVQDMIVDGVMSLLTLYGVWRVPNDPTPSPAPEAHEHVDGSHA